MTGAAEPCWRQWQSVSAPVTAVFAAKSLFSPAEQAEFVAARPGTRHVVLGSGTHDAHLDATAEWAAALCEGPPGELMIRNGTAPVPRDPGAEQIRFMLRAEL